MICRHCGEHIAPFDEQLNYTYWVHESGYADCENHRLNRTGPINEARRATPWNKRELWIKFKERV